MKRTILCVLLAALLLLPAAMAEQNYRQITQEEARRILDEEADCVLLDVRTEEEYDEGHIPGAINLDNEDIGTEEILELPDRDRMILVYCRSGRRSKEAAEKLAALGYTQVLEFGGILTWPGEIVTTEEEKGMKLRIGETLVPVTWEENASVEALRALLPLEIQLSMYGGFEQVGAIGADLPRSDEPTNTVAGDIVLYSGNQIVIFYGGNAWAYTRLGHVELPEEEMAGLLGKGDVVITLSEGR